MKSKIESCRHTLLTIAIVATATISGPAAAWNSNLYPSVDGVNFTRPAVPFNGRTWQLPDFSFVGYQLGAVAPGTDIPCRVERLTGTADISTALQAAVNRIGAAGGGTVVIPPGSYTITRSIAVPFSNVSIVGAGSNKTILNVASSYRPAEDDEEGVFTFGNSIGGNNKQWIDQGRVLGTVVQRIPEGSTTLVMANAASVAVNQWIVVQQYYWTALARANDDSGTWKGYDSAVFPPPNGPSRQWSFTYLRKVSAKSGNTVTVDAPIPMTLDPSKNAIGVRSVDVRTNGSAIRMRENVGLRGVSVNFADNANGAGGFPTGVGVFFEGVRNGWVNDVMVRNFPRHGISLESSARISVTESAAIRAQNVAGGGRGYGFVVAASQNLLFRGNYAEMTRHGYNTQFGLNSTIVYSRNESAGTRMNGDDSHFGFSQQMLWDNHRMTNGTGLLLTYRGNMSSNAQETNYSSVVWNPTDNGYRGNGSGGGMISLNPSAEGYSMLIGGSTTYPVIDDAVELGSGNVFPSRPGLQVGLLPELPRPGARNQNVVVEGLQQSGLVPASLLEQQLKSRIGAEPAAFSSKGCFAEPGKGTITRATYTGAGMNVYSGDRLGWAAAFGSACPTSMESGDLSTAAATCSTSHQGFNATPGGRYALSLLPANGNNAPIVSFGGPQTSATAYKTLTMKVYPTSATFKVAVGFADRSWGANATTTQLSSVTVSGLPANTWTTVVIPVTGLRGPSYNTIVMKGVGADSASRVYIDDVTLQ
ncbi:MAG: glycosyl hydrolase family 28-related protein [Nevskia sp.]|nr:glycosyl hydrolase family 28-related protein [Nevskia sp.]